MAEPTLQELFNETKIERPDNSPAHIGAFKDMGDLDELETPTFPAMLGEQNVFQ